MSYNNRILKFQSGGTPAQTGNYGKYIRRQLGNGRFYWVDRDGMYLRNEATEGNWIYKPNGTRVHITARKANTQAARNNTQPVTNSSVAFSPILPEFPQLFCPYFATSIEYSDI